MNDRTISMLSDAALAVAISSAEDVIDTRQHKIDDLQVQQARTHELLRLLHLEATRRRLGR